MGDREREVILPIKLSQFQQNNMALVPAVFKALIKCCDILISFSGWRYSAKLDFFLDLPEDFLPWQEFNKKEPGLHMILLVLSC